MRILNILMGLLVLESWNYQRVTEAFNLETKHYTTYTEEQGSMFGFSVTEYRDNWSQGWVIVGAPEAQTSQKDVYRGGAVYRCDITTDNRCVAIDFDKKGNNYNTIPHGRVNEMIQIDNKSLQWFGATVSSSYKDGGPLLACAPRYIWFSRTLTMREPVGTCWITNFTNTHEYSPCRTSHWGYHRQGSCQAGFGASVSKEGDRLFIGAPGSWFWQGQMYSIDNQVSYPFMPPRSAFFGALEEGQVFSQSAYDKSRVIFTKEGPAEEDDSYMGYSVVTGDFVGDGNSGIAVGMPRGVSLNGKVILFTSTMVNHHNITGEQMGAYFGYALASGDIDGDGLDDVIIGAPMYTIPDNHEKTFETGRIYVVYQGRGLRKFQKVDSRDGLRNRGRFGLSLTYLGDINRDGYGDFAVGEPYGGSEGRGAVYIYHGSSEGVLEKYSQVIDAMNLETPVQTFGFSIAGGLDLDGNGYPDLVVGSYESNTATFFRSRPVIKMNSYVEFESDSKLIDLNTRNCTLSSLDTVTCLPLKACFTYSGDDVLPRHDFIVQYVLDVKKTKSPRMFFLDHEGRNTMNRTIPVDRDIEFCRTVMVYVPPNIRDKLTSFDAEMRMSLAEDQYPDNSLRDPRTPLRPILGATTSQRDTLSVRKNCHSNKICVPDLQLTVKPDVDKYLLGSGERLQLTVLVQNVGEDAFEAMFYLNLPPGINYINIEKVNMSGILVQCSAPPQSRNNVLRCDIGNPLPRNKSVEFIVLLQPVISDGMKATYEFEMKVNTTNPERNTTGDNRRYLSLPIWINTVLHIVGESKPKDLYYNPDNFTAETAITESEFGPAFTHNYTIRNYGPSEVIEAEAYLIWPAKTIADEELLYLLAQPEMSGPISCETANANYLSLELSEKRKNYISPAASSGVIDKDSSSRKTMNVQREYELTENDRRKFDTEQSKANTDDISEIHRTQQKNTVTSGTRWDQREESHGATHGTDSFDNKDQIHTNVHGSSGSSSGQETRVHSNVTSRFHHKWDNADAQPDSEISVEQVESDRRYNEFIRRQKDERRRQEDERRRQEAERIRQSLMARRKIAVDTETSGNHEQVYGTEKHYTDRSETQRGHTTVYGTSTKIHDDVIGDREETVGGSDMSLILRRMNSIKNLEEFFNKLGNDAGAYNIYDKQGRQFAMFDGKFNVAADGKEYIEFKNGMRFDLKNKYGEQSYTSSDQNLSRHNSFLKLEGQLITDQDGKQYIQLKDGRMFPMQTSYTYTEERTDSLGGEPRESFRTYSSGHGYHDVSRDEDEAGKTYGSSWHEESSSRGNEEGRDFAMYSSRSHEEKHSSEKKYNTRLHGRDSEVHVPAGDNVPTNRPDQRRNSRYRRESDVMSVEEFRKYEKHQHHHHHRHRREDNFNQNPEYAKDFTADINFPSCTAAKCIALRCTLGPLKKDEEVWISTRYRVKAKTLKKFAFNEQVEVSTKLVAQVTKQPFIGSPIDHSDYSGEITTKVHPTAPPLAPDVVPLWVVVLSACAGTIILLLLIYLLHKCGFFKRTRPTDAPERQPLNRNGHF